MSRVILVKKGGWEQPGGSGTDSKWAAQWFVATENPLRLVDDIRKARRFPSMVEARNVKRALFLDRLLAARRLPEWFR